MAKRISAEQRVIWAAMAWQEYNDRLGHKWVRGSPIGKLLTACRRFRNRKNPGPIILARTSTAARQK